MVATSKTSPRCWTDEIIAFVREHSPNHSRAELAELINTQFGTSFSTGAVKSFCAKNKIHGRCARFGKGQKPWNKGMKGLMIGGKETRFKKGQVPKNHRPVGSERLSKNGFLEIKVAEPDVWRAKHRVIYEQVHGEIPKGHMIRFIDGDQLNVSPSNLIAISKRANVLLNSNCASLKHLLGYGHNLTVINIAQLKATISEKTQ